jgi:hypothetical protein
MQVGIGYRRNHMSKKKTSTTQERKIRGKQRAIKKPNKKKEKRQ